MRRNISRNERRMAGCLRHVKEEEESEVRAEDSEDMIGACDGTIGGDVIKVQVNWN